MTDTSATHGLFAELLEGAKALEERPTILAERDNAKREAEQHKGTVDQYKQWHEDMATQIAQLKEALANKEADLDHATFREGQVRAQLEMLVGAFKTVVGEAQAAVELVEPKPAADVAVATEVTQSAAVPFQGDTASQVKDSNDTSGSNTVTGNLTATEQPDTVQAAGTVSNGGNGASDPFATNPASSEPSSQAAGTDTAPTGNSADTNQAQGNPNAKAYWNKPTSETWRSWTASGGERPHWVEDAQLDTVY